MPHLFGENQRLERVDPAHEGAPAEGFVAFGLAQPEGAETPSVTVVLVGKWVNPGEGEFGRPQRP